MPLTAGWDPWNGPAIKAVQEYGKGAPSFVKYAASKTLAERAAWQLVKEQNPQFDLVAILPSYL
jgi:hypothetical protein